jgi:hypothetical protein
MRLDIADVQHKLGRVEAMMTRSMASIEKKSRMTSQAMVKDTKNFMHVSRGAARTFSLDWWKRFGEVAIGFSIAYRAMMAVELAIKGVLQTFKIGLDAIDEFNMGVISIAASLQMLTKVPSQESLEAYLKFGEIMFKKMEILAIRHFATGEQLQMAFTKMVTLGIVPHTEAQLEAMAALVDRILMATKGLDAGRQIVTETQAAIEGMMRPGAIVAKELASLVENYKDLIKEKDKEHIIIKKTAIFLEGIAKPLEAVSSVSDEIMKTMQAWVASIKTAGTIMLRAGLDKMYIDIVGALKDIVGYLIDKNGLTEKGIALAYVYTASWESVKTAMLRVKDVGVTIGALYKAFTFNIPIMSNFLWALNMGVTTLKYGLKSVIIMIEELQKSLKMPEAEDFIDKLAEDLKGKGTIEQILLLLTLPIGLVAKGAQEAGKELGKASVKAHDAAVDLNKKANDELDESNKTLIERIGERQEKLVVDLNAELLKIKLPHEWLEPEKFEEFAEQIRKTQSELTEEILAMLAKLRKGTDEEDEKTRKVRLRKERQLLTFMAQMQRDYLTKRLEQIEANAEAEYQMRLVKIKELVVDEEARTAFEVAALKARNAKLLIITGTFTEGLKAALEKRVDDEMTAYERGLNILELRETIHEEYLKHVKTSFDLERYQAKKHYDEMLKDVRDDLVSRVELKKTYVANMADIDKAEREQDLAGTRSTMSTLADGFKMMSEMGGSHAEEMFAAHKAFKIVEAIMSTRAGAIKAYESMLWIPVVGQALGVAAAAAVTTFGMAQVAMIKEAQMPSFDQGGISTTPGIYYAGVPEAHIPLKDLKVSSGQKPSVIIHMENPIFQDVNTQRQVFAQIAETIARQVAPDAVIQNYSNDLGIRQMVRGGM